MRSSIDDFLALDVWSRTHVARLVPVAERAEVVTAAAGTPLFEQLYPAEHFWLLVDGAVGHRTRGDAAWPLGRVDWPFGALGWSGFLPPHRYGTSAHVESDATLLRWRHEELATCFYADPALAVDFLRLVVDSVRRQFEAVRAERIARAQPHAPAAPGRTADAPGARRFAPGLVTALRRSSFFEQFGDTTLVELARDGRPEHFTAGARIASQDEPLGGLRILADGATTSFFADPDDATRARTRFRSIPAGGAIVAGVPDRAGGYVAEATVIATRGSWLYRIDTGAIERLVAADPEFGRAYMQRCLARLAQLLSAVRLGRRVEDEEPELTAVKGVIEQNQARIPVTSELHKVVHLLKSRLTIGNAFACLKTTREMGRYEERAVARTCEDLLENVSTEHEFHRDVLEAYAGVVEAAPETAAHELRLDCDRRLERAFARLDTYVAGLENLPASSGHVFIINHLKCPPDYALPNGYHFSFDTAFVSMLLARRYGESPVRVVRQSPGAEYGHNLFYRRLGHITVPTVESEHTDSETLGHVRRAAADAFFEAGRAHLEHGGNLLICPEGSSQRAEDSPARLFSGAFRLAQRVTDEPLIVPVALAGFERRYKDSRLTALVQPPFRLSEAMAAAGIERLREFLDDYRVRFAAAVRHAQALSAGTAAATPPAADAAGYRSSSAEIC